MGKTAIGIYGAGGFGREVMSLLPETLPYLFPNQNSKNINLFFIDDYVKLQKIDGFKVLRLDEFLSMDGLDLKYNIAISDTAIREKVFLSLKSSIANPISLIFNETKVMGNSKIGDGAIIMPHSIISTSVEIGIFCHINFQSYIAHDCTLGNFVTISPRVTCCGNTLIGDGAFIGAGSTIRQGTAKNPRYIGANTTLGIGSNLLGNLPDNSTYFGNPASKSE